MRDRNSKFNLDTNSILRRVNLRKGKKLQKALIDWYKVKYKSMVLPGKIFCDGIVLKKNPLNDNGGYIIIEIKLKKFLFFKKLDHIYVYDVNLKHPIKEGEKIVLHLPEDLKIQFIPYYVSALDELDLIICEYFNNKVKILKHRYRAGSIGSFLEKQKLTKKYKRI